MKKIAIIGGGIAGLAAARELSRHNCEVILFEAKDRLGGRIHSIPSGGAVVELGAEFLHGQSASLQNVIQAAGLSNREISLDNKIFENGVFRTENVWDEMSRIIHRIDPQKPDCSLGEFLAAENISDEMRRVVSGFVNGFHAAPTDRISAHSLLRAEFAAEHMMSTAQSRLDAGYSALIDFLAAEVRARGVKIVTSAPVSKMNWQPGRVELEIQRGKETEMFKVDAAIITVSLGVLKSGAIEFQPPLGKKQEAIDQLLFGNAVKISLVFREKCWPDFTFIQAPTEALPTWWTSAHENILIGWAGGPQADALVALPPEQLEELALTILKKLFPKFAGALQVNFIASHYHNWTNDPHVGGAYSYLPVNGLDLPKLLAAPLAQTLFFAGEATVFDAQTGLVSEAYDTGLRAAREVFKSGHSI